MARAMTVALDRELSSKSPMEVAGMSTGIPATSLSRVGAICMADWLTLPNIRGSTM